MATVRLIIRKNKINTEGKCVIYVRYTHEADSFLISTGEKIEPEFWDEKNQKAKKHTGFTSLNDTIESKADEIKAIARVAKQQKIAPTVEYIRSRIEAEQPKKESHTDESMDLLGIYEHYLTETEVQKSEATITQHRTVITRLREFQEIRKFKLSFEKLNQTFYEKFLNFMIKDKEYGNNTAGKYIKNLKAFLNWATDKGYNKDLHYKKFKKPKSPTDIIYITRAELDTIVNFDFSKSKKLERVRDLFVFECATGLRYSDLQNLKPENIKEKVLDFMTIKTQERLIVPLTSYAKRILDKYEGGLPEPIADTNMNKYLKEMGEMCGIDDEVQIIKISGNRRIQTKQPKYKLITTHTARRTFVTQSLERGIRPEVVMKITGHKDYKTMMKYVKITDSVVRNEMLQGWDN